MTNIERLQAMSAEKLSDFICEGIDCAGCPIHELCFDLGDIECNEAWKIWLECEEDCVPLRLCPFCNEKPKVMEKDMGSLGKYYISCENESCHVQPKTCFYKTKTEAAKVWNGRGNNDEL